MGTQQNQGSLPRLWPLEGGLCPRGKGPDIKVNEDWPHLELHRASWCPTPGTFGGKEETVFDSPAASASLAPKSTCIFMRDLHWTSQPSDRQIECRAVTQVEHVCLSFCRQWDGIQLPAPKNCMDPLCTGTVQLSLKATCSQLIICLSPATHSCTDASLVAPKTAPKSPTAT